MNRTHLAAVPVAMLGVVASGSVAAAAPSEPDPVDSAAISAPPVSRPVPRGASPRAASGENLLDVPERALAAYQRAAAVMAPADPTCHVGPDLLAAVGRVESNHGRYAAWRLGPRSRMFPALVGSPVPADQAKSSPLADSDGGVFDGDAMADHPLGPLQLLPGVWRQVAIDGDGDGLRSPDDLDDAALGLAVALCDGDLDLSSAADRAEALAQLNSRSRYARSVEAFRAAYAAPLPVTPVSVYSIATIVTPPEPEPAEEPTDEATAEPAPGPTAQPTKPTPQPGTSTPGTSTPGTSTPSPTTPTTPPSSTPAPAPVDPTPVIEPTPTPEPEPTTDPEPEVAVTDSSEPTGEAAPELAATETTLVE